MAVLAHAEEEPKAEYHCLHSRYRLFRIALQRSLRLGRHCPVITEHVLEVLYMAVFTAEAMVERLKI